jgi:hypothetical protein
MVMSLMVLLVKNDFLVPGGMVDGHVGMMGWGGRERVWRHWANVAHSLLHKSVSHQNNIYAFFVPRRVQTPLTNWAT